VRGEQGLAARLTFFCGAARSSKVAHERVEAPQVPGPADLPAVLKEGQGPTFAANYDIRTCPVGFLQRCEPEFLMWARMKEPTGLIRWSP
jgi:hypothetical protein